MAPNRGRGRAADFDDLLDTNPQDFDPENDNGAAESDSSEDEEIFGVNEDEARSHYVDVEKSKLRKPKSAPLGPQYQGSRIGRQALDEEDEDDPFERGIDEHSSEDDQESGGELSDEDGDADTPETDMSEETAQQKTMDTEEDRAKLRQMMAEEQRSVATSIAQAIKADAEKGRAVKKQRATFDALLNTRIKLQRALVGVNTIAALQSQNDWFQDRVADEAVSAAEVAAYNLWSSLCNYREELSAAKTGEKRKRSAFDIQTPTEELAQLSQSLDADALSHRQAVLQKWSVKVQGPSTLPARSRLNNTAQQATIIDVIQEQLTNPERLIKRTQTPRSCAPVQLSNKTTQDERIFDDADFYGLLLKELLEQKGNDSAAASSVDLSFQLRREAKTKKQVDTKASKGRKLRYTVHEKLQNFMAPEDRCTWGEKQTDELFGSLFGQRLALGEEKEDDNVEEQEEDEAGLMMFGR